MARAETIESVAEAGGGGNGPLSHPNTCRMELPHPLHAWPGLLATTTISTTTSNSGLHSGAMHVQHSQHPLQAFCVSYLLPHPHSQGRDEPRTHQDFPALSPTSTPPPTLLRDALGDQPDQDGRDNQQVSGQHPPPAVDEAAAALNARRVAHQLRTIGDEFNATAQRRMHVAPQWQEWRDVCRGLLNFVTQTLSTLYRLT
ncbi:unnamed protein product [Ophioblennius macclurei]